MNAGPDVVARLAPRRSPDRRDDADDRAEPDPHPDAELGFGGLALRVVPGVLVPRPWTVLQADWAVALDAALPSGPVVELCTGAGQIGLEVVRRTGRPGILVDADERACWAAMTNAARNGLAGRVEVRHADLATAIRPDETPVLLLADPPYLRTAEVERYPDDPRLAVDGGPDGMAVVRRVVHATAPHVRAGAPLLLQLRGLAQAARLDAWLAQRPALGLAVRAVQAPTAERAVALLGPADDPAPAR